MSNPASKRFPSFKSMFDDAPIIPDSNSDKLSVEDAEPIKPSPERSMSKPPTPRTPLSSTLPSVVGTDSASVTAASTTSNPGSLDYPVSYPTSSVRTLRTAPIHEFERKSKYYDPCVIKPSLWQSLTGSQKKEIVKSVVSRLLQPGSQMNNFVGSIDPMVFYKKLTSKEQSDFLVFLEGKRKTDFSSSVFSLEINKDISKSDRSTLFDRLGNLFFVYIDEFLGSERFRSITRSIIHGKTKKELCEMFRNFGLTTTVYEGESAKDLVPYQPQTVVIPTEQRPVQTEEHMKFTFELPESEMNKLENLFRNKTLTRDGVVKFINEGKLVAPALSFGSDKSNFGSDKSNFGSIKNYMVSFRLKEKEKPKRKKSRKSKRKFSNKSKRTNTKKRISKRTTKKRISKRKSGKGSKGIKGVNGSKTKEVKRRRSNKKIKKRVSVNKKKRRSKKK